MASQQHPHYQRILAGIRRYRWAKRIPTPGGGHPDVTYLDEKLGKPRGYLARFLSGGVDLKVNDLFRILDVLEVEADEFSTFVFGSELPSLAILLEDLASRSGRGVQPIARRLEEWTPPARADSSGLDEWLDRADEERFLSGKLPEEEVESILETAFARGGVRQLCKAVALSAAVERANANLANGAELLRAGLQLAEKHAEEAGAAEIERRALYIFSNLGQNRLAARLADRVISRYLIVDDRPAIGKVLTDKGVMLGRCGDHDGALRAYEAAQQYVDPQCWTSSFALSQASSVAHLLSGDLDRAQVHAERAAAFHKTMTGKSWGKLQWLRGEIAFHRCDHLVAEKELRSAVVTLRSCSHPVELALVSLDRVKVLLHLGRFHEVTACCQHLKKVLTPLSSCNPTATAALYECIRAGLSGSLTAVAISKTAAKISLSRHDADVSSD